jgi:hypothetical protein
VVGLGFLVLSSRLFRTVEFLGGFLMESSNPLPPLVLIEELPNMLVGAGGDILVPLVEAVAAIGDRH